MSGGIDSASCVYFFKQQGYSVNGIFVDYGQAARQQEWLAVERLKKILDIDIQRIQVSALDVFGAGELVGRNVFLISSAMFLAGVQDGLLVIGIHAGTPYYDCSFGFVERMKQITEEHTSGRLTISAPFLDWDKRQIYRYFSETGLPVEATYSCELGAVPPCGVCASCQDRRKLGC